MSQKDKDGPVVNFTEL